MSIKGRGRSGRIGLATVMTGLMMGTLTSGDVEASAIKPKAQQKPVYYSTSGTIGTPGGTPVEFVSFEGIGSSSPSTAPGGVFFTPGAFSLGQFRTSGLPAGESRTFDDLPFSITMRVFESPFVSDSRYSIEIDGVLDGELSNDPGKGLLASISSVRGLYDDGLVLPFRVEDLTILAPQFILPAGPLPTVTTPIYAYVDTQVPEPTALATLGVGAAALVVHRYRRRRARSRVVATG